MRESAFANEALWNAAFSAWASNIQYWFAMLSTVLQADGELDVQCIYEPEDFCSQTKKIAELIWQLLLLDN